MGCQCARSDLSDKVMNAFWENLKIRNKKIQEIVDMIRTKKQSARDKIKPNKLLMLIEDLIQGENFIEQTQQMFSNALEYSRSEYKNEGLFFLSLLLLGTGTADDFVKSFLSVAMTQGGLKYYIEISPEENKNNIEKKELENFINYYINLVTLFGVKDLATLTDNKDLFEENMNKAYSKEAQSSYIKENVMKGYENEAKVDIETFFKANYEKLKGDSIIRTQLYNDFINQATR